MEQDINENNKIDSDKNHFKLHYKNQDINKILEFKEWYKNTKEEVKIKNMENYDLYTICFCEKCWSYSICIFPQFVSYVKCTNCNYKFCPGCLKEINEEINNSVCLKGILLLYYLKIKYRILNYKEKDCIDNFISIIIAILFTPMILSYSSFFIGFSSHKKKELEILSKNWIFKRFSFLNGLLMFPYLIIFFAIMIIIFIFSIIFRKLYYFLIFIYYILKAPLNPEDGRSFSDIDDLTFDTLNDSVNSNITFSSY